MQVEKVGRAVVGFEHSQYSVPRCAFVFSSGRIVNRKDRSA
jgi:hypothetical protein